MLLINIAIDLMPLAALKRSLYRFHCCFGSIAIDLMPLAALKQCSSWWTLLSFGMIAIDLMPLAALKLRLFLCIIHCANTLQLTLCRLRHWNRSTLSKMTFTTSIIAIDLMPLAALKQPTGYAARYAGLHCNWPYAACGIETSHNRLKMNELYYIAIDLMPLAALKQWK